MDNSKDVKVEKVEIINKHPEFEFVVEGMSRELADKLLDIITTFADSHNLFVCGGFVMREESEDDTEV